MGCSSCGGGNKSATAKLSWTVDLAGTDKSFADGTTKKKFALASEAATAISNLGLAGKVRPRPTAG